MKFLKIIKQWILPEKREKDIEVIVTADTPHIEFVPGRIELPKEKDAPDQLNVGTVGLYSAFDAIEAKLPSSKLNVAKLEELRRQAREEKSVPIIENIIVDHEADRIEAVSLKSSSAVEALEHMFD